MDNNSGTEKDVVVYIKPDPDTIPGLSAETAIELCNSQEDDVIIKVEKDSTVVNSGGDQSVKDELEQVKASLAALSKQLEIDRAENERLRTAVKRKADDVKEKQKHRKCDNQEEGDGEKIGPVGNEEENEENKLDTDDKKEHEMYLNQLFATWNNPGQRFHLQPKQVKRAIQRALLTKERDKEFAIDNLNGYEGHLVHGLCDSVGLEHESKGYGPNRVLKVSKPVNWTVRSINLEKVSFAPKKPTPQGAGIRRAKKSHFMVLVVAALMTRWRLPVHTIHMVMTRHMSARLEKNCHFATNAWTHCRFST